MNKPLLDNVVSNIYIFPINSTSFHCSAVNEVFNAVIYSSLFKDVLGSNPFELAEQHDDNVQNQTVPEEIAPYLTHRVTGAYYLSRE